MHTEAQSLIDALGGTSAVCRLVGKPANVVSNWKARNRIPPEYFLLVSAAAAEQQQMFDVSAVFGMVEPPEDAA